MATVNDQDLDRLIQFAEGVRKFAENEDLTRTDDLATAVLEPFQGRKKAFKRANEITSEIRTDLYPRMKD